MIMTQILRFISLMIAMCIMQTYAQQENFTDRFPHENGVFLLTEKTLEEAIRSFPYLLVNLCKPYDPLCQSFDLNFEEIANTLKTQIPKVFCAQLDLSAYPSLEEKEGITSYPTLIFHTYGRKLSLSFITVPRLIVAWVNKYLTFASTSLGTIREVKEVVNQTDFVSVVYFGHNKSEMIEFESYAFGDHKRFFGKCSNKLAYQYYNVTPSTIVLFKPYDEKRIDYNQTIEKDAIEKFVIENSHELVAKCNAKTYSHTIQERFPSLFYFRSEKYVTNDEVLLKYAANKYKGSLHIFACDRTTKEEQSLMKELNITDRDLPVILLADYRKGRRAYTMKKQLTAGMINEFISEWILGKMMIYTRTEPAPYHKPGDGEVYEVVAKTYYSDVIDNDLDVFVLFHGDNCGFCDYVFPIYRELAKKLSQNRLLRIASFNLSLNDFDVFEYGPLPWMVFFPSRKKINRVLYKGLIHVEDFEPFLLSHATHKITLDELKADL